MGNWSGPNGLATEEDLLKGWVEACPEGGLCGYKAAVRRGDINPVSKINIAVMHPVVGTQMNWDYSTNKPHKWRFACCGSCGQPWSHAEAIRLNKLLGHKSPVADFDLDDFINNF